MGSFELPALTHYSLNLQRNLPMLKEEGLSFNGSVPLVYSRSQLQTRGGKRCGRFTKEGGQGRRERWQIQMQMQSWCRKLAGWMGEREYDPCGKRLSESKHLSNVIFTLNIWEKNTLV